MGNDMLGFVVYCKRGRAFCLRGIMKLFQSWKESLSLLRPENLTPFLLVSVKTVRDVYRSINTPLTSQGYWLLGTGVFGLIAITNVVKLFNLFWLDEIMLNSMRYFCVFMFTLALRPSIEQKSWSYFHSYMQRYWYTMIFMIFFGIFYVFVIPLAFIWTVFFLLSAFDTSGTVNGLKVAMRTSFTMLLYNAPICIVLYGLLSVINVMLYYFIGFALGFFGGLTLAALLYILFVPIEIALISNLYIKFIHGQPSLYFQQPE